MSKSEQPQNKSRRRFLADMLFIGGGATAAAILAKSLTVAPPPADPNASPAPCSTPKKLADPIGSEGPYPGNAEFPQHLIENPQPQSPPTLGDPAPQEEAQCEEPMIEGRTVAPKQ